MNAKLVISGLMLVGLSSIASAQDSKIPYPPADAPLYLECKLQGVGETKTYKDWDSLVLYFPDGSGGAFLNVEVVDPKNQTAGAHFSFTMKSETSWSLYATNKVPSSGQQLSELPRIVFLPPSGKGETLKVGYGVGRDIQRLGVCLGMIGPDTKGAFERAKKDPSPVDKK